MTHELSLNRGQSCSRELLTSHLKQDSYVLSECYNLKTFRKLSF